MASTSQSFISREGAGEGVGSTVANESALRSARPFCCGFEPHNRCPGLTRAQKPEIILLWTGYIRKKTFLRDFVAKYRRKTQYGCNKKLDLGFVIERTTTREF
ncbi:hypothetical protein PoB_007022700 [Plakobranchus ocellatus]|uniref:Uncharacterized protein n=1 Tax=Plakobranchus ocellatus TaxID=259542 RepID=A0AAV4DHI9_9GAST|nr:hypothetical protein PoB_007022700 [Plakobranchus ocellatus]